MDVQDSKREKKLAKRSEGDHCGASIELKTIKQEPSADVGCGIKLKTVKPEPPAEVVEKEPSKDVGCGIKMKAVKPELPTYADDEKTSQNSGEREQEHGSGDTHTEPTNLKNLFIGEYNHEKATSEGMQNWLDLSAYKDCGKNDLQVTGSHPIRLINKTALNPFHPLADSLVGKRLAPDKADDFHLTLVLYFWYHALPPIYLDFPNRLTASAGFELGHFLKHLDGHVFEMINYTVKVSFPADLRFAIHFQRLCIWASILPSTLQEMIDDVFKPQGVELHMNHFRDLDETISTIVGCGQTSFPIKPIVRCRQKDKFDKVLEYCRTHDMRSFIPPLQINLRDKSSATRDNWPMKCYDPMKSYDPKEAIISVEEQKRDGKYLFLREKSGKRYHVEMKRKVEKGKNKVDSMTFLFNI